MIWAETQVGLFRFVLGIKARGDDASFEPGMLALPLRVNMKKKKIEDNHAYHVRLWNLEEEKNSRIKNLAHSIYSTYNI